MKIKENPTRLDIAGTWRGIRMMLPLAVFTIAFGLAFGVAAVHQGLAGWEAMLMSLFVFAAPSQFAALEMWHSPLPLLALAAVTLAIHTRHMLMSAALYPWLKALPQRQQFAMVILLTDSNWAMALGEYQRGERNLGILLGGGIALWGAWVGGTAIGLAFGGGITEPERFGLDVIMLCFLLMIVVGGNPRAAMALTLVGSSGECINGVLVVAALPTCDGGCLHRWRGSRAIAWTLVQGKRLMSSSPVWQSLIAIMLMVVIAYGSRVLGLLIMSRVPLGPRVRRFVDAMSSSVLIAVITPIIVHGDGGVRLAAIAAGTVAVVMRNPLVSITMGMLCAAGWRWWVG